MSIETEVVERVREADGNSCILGIADGQRFFLDAESVEPECAVPSWGHLPVSSWPAKNNECLIGNGASRVVGARYCFELLDSLDL